LVNSNLPPAPKLAPTRRQPYSSTTKTHPLSHCRSTNVLDNNTFGLSQFALFNEVQNFSQGINQKDIEGADHPQPVSCSYAKIPIYLFIFNIIHLINHPRQLIYLFIFYYLKKKKKKKKKKSGKAYPPTAKSMSVLVVGPWI